MNLASRLDASLLDAAELNQLADLLVRERQPSLVGREGTHIELPKPIFDLLVQVIRNMREGRAMVLLPEDESFTTQAGADFLGMSRQFFVDLLEKGEMPFHRVGTHRRVYLKDLLAYQRSRDKTRHAELSELFTEVDAAGVYDAVLVT